MKGGCSPNATEVVQVGVGVTTLTRLRVCVLCVCFFLVRLRACLLPRFALSNTSLCLLITCCTSRVTIFWVVIMHRCITARCADHRACMHVLVYAPATAPFRCVSSDKIFLPPTIPWFVRAVRGRDPFRSDGSQNPFWPESPPVCLCASCMFSGCPCSIGSGWIRHVVRARGFLLVSAHRFIPCIGVGAILALCGHLFLHSHVAGFPVTTFAGRSGSG